MAKRSFKPKMRGSMPSMRGNRKTAFDPKKRPAPDLTATYSGLSIAAEAMMMGGADSVDITASRTTGVAPLSVFFEAVVHGYAGTNPFHNLLYVWDFGEPSAGNWAYGNPLNLAKNEATGPIAAHVFAEDGSASTPTVTLSVYARRGGVTSLFATKTVVITTTSETTAFNVASNCVSYSNDTVHTGAFSNATERDSITSITSSQFATDYAAGIRCWQFQKGDTFDIADSHVNMNGLSDIMFQGVGTGDLPVLNGLAPTTGFGLFSWTGGTNDEVRYREVHIGVDLGTGDSGDYPLRVRAKITNFLMHDCEIGLADRFEGFQSSQLINSGSLSDGFFIVGTQFGLGTLLTGSRTGCIYMSAYHMVVMGCNLDGRGAEGETAGNHTYRMYHQEDSICQHNTFLTASVAGAELDDLKFSAAGDNHSQLGYPWMERILISDNLFESTVADWISVCGPQSDSPTGETERARDVIYERNYFTPIVDTGTSPGIGIYASNPNITIRNNVFDMTLRTGGMRNVYVGKRDPSNATAIVNVWIYNNSTVALNSAAEPHYEIATTAEEDGVEISNNLVHEDGTGAMIDANGVAHVDSNNSKVTSSPFATDPPTAIAHFRLASSDPAEDAGGEVTGLFEGFERTAISGVNIGAFQTDP